MIYTATYPPQHPRPAMEGYRHFFNGQEGEDEVLGEGGFQNYGFRMYDTRIARFWGVDPLAKNYPMLLVDVDGLEGIENTIGYTSDGVPFRYFNARQSTYVKPKALPEVELKRPLFHVATKRQLPFVGEIRPAPSEYEKAWVESAGYFGTYIYLDPIVRATAAGGLVVTAGLFGTYVGTDFMPYAVNGTGELYSVGLKIYNNPWGKLSIGAGTGWVGYKQDWSPDINFPDPIISTSSQYFQFFFSTLDKSDILFDVGRDNNSNINNKSRDYVYDHLPNIILVSFCGALPFAILISPFVQDM